MSGELLIEFYSEEIPARMQGQAELQFAHAMEKALKKEGIGFDTIQCFSTPRRLALCVSGIAKSVSRAGERKKGVRVGAPQKAIDGFLRSVGVSDVGKLETEKDDKSAYYVVIIPAKIIKTADIIAEIVPDIVRGFPWQKSMRWGEGSLSWVRPLRSILAVLDGKIVPFSVGGVASGNVTYGHPFLAPEAIKCADFKAYQQGLKKAFVVLEAGKRKEAIRKKAEALAAKKGLVADLDEALLSEIAALVESPHVLMGAIEKKYISIPIEVSISVMRIHQKYIPLADKKRKLAPFFLITANIADSEKMIVQGNERVLSARLADAQFFFEEDKKTSLEEKAKMMGGILSHGNITFAEMSRRVGKLAEVLMERFGGKEEHKKNIRRVAQLAKADLVSKMVQEFSHLQGVMGYYYALHDGENIEVAKAIRDQYKPVGPTDSIPETAVGVVFALAEKLYNLQYFWQIGEKPTGSKDPNALRRATIGVLRIILETEMPLSLRDNLTIQDEKIKQDLIDYINNRIPDLFKGGGIRHDALKAARGGMAKGHYRDMPLALYDCAKQLSNFLPTKDGDEVLDAYWRVRGFLDSGRWIDVNGKWLVEKECNPELFETDQERELFNATDVEAMVQRGTGVKKGAGYKRGGFKKEFEYLASLRPKVDAFADGLRVDVEDKRLKNNRLALLQRIMMYMSAYADFSQIRKK